VTDANFMESLLAAVAGFIDDAMPSPDDTPPYGTSAWGDTIDRFKDAPVTLGVPEHQGIQGIRASDPAFDLAAFLVRVGEMFSAYHQAVDRGDLTPVRRFVDETAYAQLASAAEKNRPTGPRSLTVRSIRPITARHEDDLDLVRIFITAEQSGSDELLCEYWELIRKRGTLTKPGLDLTHCPNCGAPVDGIDPTRCAYCSTRLTDPALDWVVRKITAQ
jgi:hypothetical protein